MALRFIGIDPDTGQQGSPTIWVDEENAELVLQGRKPDEKPAAECAAFEVPGHTPGIPTQEAVIRIPARMVPMLREACECDTRSLLLSG
ncbi:hypothetical protein [Streptomyces celluloflavus]|uniref:hypothetical protein n=1 Tax=Streptomyces celluloflavus TaxID=58344 RepID=UPI003460AAAD|nr:hypothetical protein OG717_13075 [Streptomyces celluloflavus]